MGLLEREYSAKLNERLGRPEGPQDGPHDCNETPGLTIAPGDLAFMQSLYDAYKQADPKTRQTFANVCKSILNVRNTWDTAKSG